MKKRMLQPSEAIDITEMAQLAALGGIVNARRWGAHELKFQGGTALHLVYGSPRFSEDLDFVMATDRAMNRIANDAAQTVQATLRAQYPGEQLTATAKHRGTEVDSRNPKVSVITITSPSWMNAIKIRLEFWVADAEAVADYASTAATARLRPEIEARVSPVIVQTADIEEILVDKLHAFADREYLKWRDIFDLWWISQVKGFSAQQAAAELQSRFDCHSRIYPPVRGLAALLDASEDRCKALQQRLTTVAGRKEAAEHLNRWLPPGNPMRERATDIANGAAEFIRQVIQHARAPRPRPKR